MNHDAANAVFDGMESGEYGSVFTSRYVLSEFATLMLYQIGHTAAIEALSTVRQSQTFNILPMGKTTFDAACEEFKRFDDQQISFVDQTSAVLAAYDHSLRRVWLFTFALAAGFGITLVGMGIGGEMPGIPFRILWAIIVGFVVAAVLGPFGGLLGLGLRRILRS